MKYLVICNANAFTFKSILTLYFDNRWRFEKITFSLIYISICAYKQVSQ